MLSMIVLIGARVYVFSEGRSQSRCFGRGSTCVTVWIRGSADYGLSGGLGFARLFLLMGLVGGIACVSGIDRLGWVGRIGWIGWIGLMEWFGWIAWIWLVESCILCVELF